jgi:hypothetical protein
MPKFAPLTKGDKLLPCHLPKTTHNDYSIEPEIGLKGVTLISIAFLQRFYDVA